MSDIGQTAAIVVGAGIVLAIDDAYDLAIDDTYALATDIGIDLSGKSAAQIV